MIENTLEQGSSFVHKLEPRTRIQVPCLSLLPLPCAGTLA